MIDNMESLNNLTDRDKYVVTVTVWKNHKIYTDCRVHDFPTRDLPIARNDISTLIHETYLKDATVAADVTAAEESLNEEVKDLLTDK